MNIDYIKAEKIVEYIIEQFDYINEVTDDKSYKNQNLWKLINKNLGVKKNNEKN